MIKYHQVIGEVIYDLFLKLGFKVELAGLICFNLTMLYILSMSPLLWTRIVLKRIERVHIEYVTQWYWMKV